MLSAYAETYLRPGFTLSVTLVVMKTNSRLVRILFATVVTGLFAVSAYAGPGIQHWRNATPITTFSEARKVSADDMIMMQCDHCKTAMMATCMDMGAMSKGNPEWCMAGAKSMCTECKGEITVVQGKTDDAMQVNCSKCGEGAVSCSMINAEKKTP